MNEPDPLTQTVLELDHALGGEPRLMIVGGLGLHLLEADRRTSTAPTLIHPSKWPGHSRVTTDVDLMLSANILLDRQQFERAKKGLDKIGCKVVPQHKHWKFERTVGHTTVTIDVLCGPFDEADIRLENDGPNGRRVRPSGPSPELHAHPDPEAIGVDEEPRFVTLGRRLPHGAHHSARILIPNAFSYAMMKLFAFESENEPIKCRHHALDLYRIIATQTEADAESAARVRERYNGHALLAKAHEHLGKHFADDMAAGLLDIRNHALYQSTFELRRFVDELGILFGK